MHNETVRETPKAGDWPRRAAWAARAETARGPDKEEILLMAEDLIELLEAADV